jgi:glycosyltransferase involved in cell wall biosynthesis
MKIVHFTLSFLPQLHGAEIVVHNLALNQMKAGHNSYVMTTRRNWQSSRKSVPYRIIPFLPKTNLDFLLNGRNRSIKRKYFEFQLSLVQKIYHFDIWNIHMAYPAGCACVEKLRRMGCPTVLTSHGNDIQTLPKIGYGRRLDRKVDDLVRKKIRDFDAIIAISGSMRWEFLDLQCDEARIADIPNGVSAKHIIDAQVDRKEVRKRYGLPPDKPILLTVGRNHPKKGYHLIPVIARILAGSGEEFTWLLVGKDIEPVREEARRLGVDDHLVLLGTIGQAKGNTDDGYMLPSLPLIEIYKASDIFVFPALLESAGLVFLEAMAAGLPVITTDAPGARDTVRHNVSGLISPVGDAKAMADNVLSLLSNDHLAMTMKATNREIVKRYDWEIVSNNYIKLYEKLI